MVSTAGLLPPCSDPKGLDAPQVSEASNGWLIAFSPPRHPFGRILYYVVRARTGNVTITIYNGTQLSTVLAELADVVTVTAVNSVGQVTSPEAPVFSKLCSTCLP